MIPIDTSHRKALGKECIGYMLFTSDTSFPSARILHLEEENNVKESTKQPSDSKLNFDKYKSRSRTVVNQVHSNS